MKIKCISIIAVMSSLISVSGCTESSDENDDEVARVEDLFFEQSVIRIGESARRLVDFTFSNQDVFDSNRNVIIKETRQNRS